MKIVVGHLGTEEGRAALERAAALAREQDALVHSVPQMHDAFDRLDELVSRADLIVPGHDPAVMERFEPSAPELRGLAVRIA